MCGVIALHSGAIRDKTSVFTGRKCQTESKRNS